MVCHLRGSCPLIGHIEQAETISILLLTTAKRLLLAVDHRQSGDQIARQSALRRQDSPWKPVALASMVQRAGSCDVHLKFVRIQARLMHCEFCTQYVQFIQNVQCLSPAALCPDRSTQRHYPFNPKSPWSGKFNQKPPQLRGRSTNGQTLCLTRPFVFLCLVHFRS